MGPFEDVLGAPDGNEFPPVCAENTKCGERREPAEPAAPGLAEEVAGKDGDAAATAFLSAAGAYSHVVGRGGGTAGTAASAGRGSSGDSVGGSVRRGETRASSPWPRRGRCRGMWGVSCGGVVAELFRPGASRAIDLSRTFARDPGSRGGGGAGDPGAQCRYIGMGAGRRPGASRCTRNSSWTPKALAAGAGDGDHG